MSSTIIRDVMAVKLRNGKTVPFVLSASNNVRTCDNSYDWQWHNVYVGKHSNFMFDNVEQLQMTVKNWAESGSVKFRNGTFVTANGLNKRLENAFSKAAPLGSVQLKLYFIKVSEDRTKAEHVSFTPKTEEEFLAYMEKNKEHSINIMISCEN